MIKNSHTLTDGLRGARPQINLTRSQLRVLDWIGSMTTLSISELARKGNVNLETVRYYEREGLMRPPQRTPSGHRAYVPGDVLRLRFIKRSQALGFTLTEIKELLALKITPNRPCIGVVRQIEVKALEVK